MYFNNHMFNPQYVNYEQYKQVVEKAQYNYEQDKKVYNAVKAIHDLFDAVNGMDEYHQQLMFNACLVEIGTHLGWK